MSVRPFNPAVVTNVKETLGKQSVESIGVTLNMDYIPMRANLALFRIAYLAMFQRGGYRYILSPAADVIRTRILDFESKSNELCYPLVAEIRNISPRPTKSLQVHWIKEGLAVSVLIRFKSIYERYYSVTMPDPRLNPDKVLNSLLEAGNLVVTRRKVGP